MSAHARAKFRSAEFAYPHPQMSWLALQRVRAVQLVAPWIEGVATPKNRWPRTMQTPRKFAVNF